MKPSGFAPRALGAALALGIVGDWLLDGRYWAVNVAVFALLTVATGFLLASQAENKIPKGAKAMALVALLFGLCFAWRDAPELKIANGIAVFLALGIMLLKAREGNVAKASVLDYTAGITGRWLFTIGDTANLLGPEMDWKNRYGATGVKRASAIAAGIAIATPLIIIFGALFASADAVFNNAVLNVFSVQPDEIIQRGAISFGIAWLVAGILQRMLSAREYPEPLPPPLPSEKVAEPLPPPSLGFTEIAIPLGAMVALFAIFVAIQFRYLFGGTDVIRATAGLTYSQYARKGFYELCAVAGIVLLVVLAARALLKTTDEKQERGFRTLVVALISLTFVIIASALNRMAIVVDEFGFSMLRFYPSAFMIWLTIAFVWLVFTVVSGKHDRFAFGAAVAGFVVVLCINVINPDGLIASFNTNPARRQMDMEYLLQLSDDAVPALASALPHLKPEQQTAVRQEFEKRSKIPMDPREWNFGRWQANQIAANAAE